MARFVLKLMSLCTLSLVPLAASASTFNVPSDFPDIQSALDSAADGDIILVAAGTYTQNLNFAGKLVALRSTSGPTSTIIDVNGGVAVAIGGAAEISGFTITGARDDFGAGMVVGGAGTLIKNNIFDSNIQTAGGYGAAIGGNGASPIIDSNVFTRNTADGQHLSGVVSFINGTNAKITNNIFADNPTRAINFTLPTGSHATITNNTFVRNHVGMKFGSFSPADVRNNIFYQNTTAFVTDYPYALPAFDHNLFFANSTNFSGTPSPDPALQLFVNPRFVSDSDFHLLPGSPAIDSGSSLLAPSDDFDGKMRPHGGLYDIGAFEFVPEPTSAGYLVSLTLVGMSRSIRNSRRRWRAATTERGLA